MTVNDIILHAAMDNLPLGGIGNSGMGAYHGETGFKTFSHARGVLYQGLLSPAQFITPPYTNKHHRFVDRILGSFQT